MTIPVFSDVHWQLIGPFSRATAGGLTTRVGIILEFFKWLSVWVRKCSESDDVLFGGDMFTGRSVINVPLYNLCLDTLESHDLNFYAILGNHDKYIADDKIHSLYAISRAISNYRLLNLGMPATIFDMEIFGMHAGAQEKIVLPPKPKGKRRILLIHELIFDTKLPAGEMHGTALILNDLKAMLKENKVDICFAGDNHRPQIAGITEDKWLEGNKVKLTPGSVVVVGAPYQMDFGDAGQPRGIWEYDSSDNSVNFVLWDDGQRFIVVGDEEFEDFMNLCASPPPFFNNVYWHVNLMEENNINVALEHKIGKMANVTLSMKSKQNSGKTDKSINGSLNYELLLLHWLEKRIKASGDRARLLTRGMQYIEQALSDQGG